MYSATCHHRYWSLRKASVDSQAFLKSALVAETSANNADYKKVLDSLAAFRNDEYLWWQVAEYTYDTFMIRSRSRS